MNPRTVRWLLALMTPLLGLSCARDDRLERWRAERSIWLRYPGPYLGGNLRIEASSNLLVWHELRPVIDWPHVPEPYSSALRLPFDQPGCIAILPLEESLLVAGFRTDQEQTVLCRVSIHRDEERLSLDSIRTLSPRLDVCRLCYDEVGRDLYLMDSIGQRILVGAWSSPRDLASLGELQTVADREAIPKLEYAPLWVLTGRSGSQPGVKLVYADPCFRNGWLAQIYRGPDGWVVDR